MVSKWAFRKGKQVKQDELVKPIDVGDIHNKHEDQFEKMLKGKLLNQKETLIKATTTGIDTNLFECNSSESPRPAKLDQ